MTTTDLGWFELMIQKWKALYPINSLPSNAKAHYFSLFVTHQEGPNANPDLESIQRNLKRHLYNLSHRAKQQLQWGNTHFHGVLFTQMHVGGWWWKVTGETWRRTWTPTLQKPSAALELQGVNAGKLPSVSGLVSAQPCFVLCCLQLAKEGWVWLWQVCRPWCALWGQIQVGTLHFLQCANLLPGGQFKPAEPFSWHKATTTGLSHGMFQPSSPPYYPHNCRCREWNFGTTVITLCPCVNSSNTVIREYQEYCAGCELWLLPVLAAWC